MCPSAAENNNKKESQTRSICGYASFKSFEGHEFFGSVLCLVLSCQMEIIYFITNKTATICKLPSMDGLGLAY